MTSKRVDPIWEDVRKFLARRLSALRTGLEQQGMSERNADFCRGQIAAMSEIHRLETPEEIEESDVVLDDPANFVL